MAWMKRYEEEIDRGEVAQALTTAMLGTRMGPPIFNYLPRVLLVSLTKLMMRGEEGTVEKGKKGENSTSKDSQGPPTVRDLAPTLRNDFKVATETVGETNLQAFVAVQTETLILGGSRSPAYLRRSSRELEKILPNQTRVELAGVDHGVTNNRGGNPAVVAEELRKFFSRGNEAEQRIST